MRRRLGAVVAALFGAAIVSGCSTTQDEAARLQLNSSRIRVAEKPTVVHSAGDRLKVGRVSLVSSGHGSAFVVQLRNPGRAAVADLPITVGVTQGHHRRVLVNAKPDSANELTAYPEAHLPAVAAGASLTWVFSTTRSFAHDARPFALVGDHPSPAVSSASGGGPAPVLSARVIGQTALGTGRGKVRISLHNSSSVPQYQLGVYAVGRRAGRPVAAGELTVAHLGSHKNQTLSIPVIGSLQGARFQLAAVPTIDH